MAALRLSKREIRELEAERAYWQSLAKALGWRLHGWSGRGTATFFTGKEPRRVYNGDPLYDAVVPPRANHSDFLQIRGEQRDDIVAAIRKAKGAKWKQHRRG